MKKLISLNVILFITLLCTSFYISGVKSVPRTPSEENLTLLPPQIAYTESSSGLQTVQWEGGRTEIEFADINNDGFKDLISIGDHGNPYVNTQDVRLKH